MNSVLITGGTRGIGLGVARLYGSNGFHCFLNYLSDDANAELALNSLRGDGASASLVRADVRSEDAVVEMMLSIAETNYSLETVVINAVDEVPKAVDQATLDEWHQVLLTKLDGAFLVTKHAVPLLVKAANPAVVHITSVDGARPDGTYLGYQVGTAGLVAMTIANATYLCKKYGIRVNAVSPGPVKTDLWRKAGESEGIWEGFDQRTPVGRVADFDDVARAVWFVAEDPRRFINGTTVNIDGGLQWT